MPKIKSTEYSTITTWKAGKYLKIWQKRTTGQVLARLKLTNKFSVWVQWKLFCHFWPIKPHNFFAHVVLLTFFFLMNFMWFSLRMISQRFLLKTGGEYNSISLYFWKLRQHVFFFQSSDVSTSENLSDSQVFQLDRL